MSIFKGRENYLKALCIAHPLIAHTQMEDGKARNSFFRINDDLEIDASVLNNMSYPCVAYNNISGRIRDNGKALVAIDHVFKNEWLFLTDVDPGTDTDGIGKVDRIDDAYDLTFGIMEDFINAMKEDYVTDGNCGAFIDFDIEKMSYQRIGPLVQKEYGWILSFEDTHPASRIMDGTDNGWTGGIAGANQTEVIFIVNENGKVISWTDARKLQFGIMPIVEVYLQDINGNYYMAAVQPTLDAAPPVFTTMTFSFNKNENGFIIIK